MPVTSNPRTDSEIFNSIEAIHTNVENRWTKDDLTSILSGTNGTNNITSKQTSSERPTVEILRAKSPTLKRLVAVRVKLDKYVNSLSNTISTSRQSIRETSYSSKPLIANAHISSSKHEKPSTANVRISSSSQKPSVSTVNLGKGPLDKITYEKTCSRNGNVKQKCSLEIWLPKAGSDEEDNGNTNRTTSPDSNLNEKKSQSPQTMTTKSRRSSIIKIPTANIETKSVDEASPKKSEPIVVPRVYHYGDYLTEQPEERSRSSVSGDTSKSDGGGSNKSAKRQRARPHTLRQSGATNQSEEIVQPGTTIIPMTSKNLLSNIKQTNPHYETRGSSHSFKINELMKKYSMIKKSHQELTQAKLQLQKPNHDSKTNAPITKDHSPPSPPVSDSASCSSSEHPSISVKKLLVDTSPPRSAVDPNKKLIDRRSAHHKPLYFDILPQARLFSLVHHIQYRQTSASKSTALLPSVVGKKNDDSFRSFQRSKTLNVASDVLNDTTSSIKIPSRLPRRPDSPEAMLTSSNLFPSAVNGIEQTSSYISKRPLPPPPPPPLPTLRPEQQKVVQPIIQLVQYQNVQNSAQRYHHSAHSSTTTSRGAPTNKVLVHLKYSNGGNTDRNCLVPE